MFLELKTRTTTYDANVFIQFGNHDTQKMGVTTNIFP